VNANPHAELSRSTPLAYVGFWLLLTVPPATFVLAAPLVTATRRAALLAWPFLTFVVVHSLVPHKEDRFMLPVLPLFLVLFAAAVLLLEDEGAQRWPRLARLWPATRAFLIGVHALALVIAVTNQSQGNLREAMAAIHEDATATGVVSLGPELQTYFLGERRLPAERRSHIDGDWLAATLAAMSARGESANRFLAFAPDRDRVALLLAGEGLACDEPQELDGYWLDRLLYRFNPERNRRRAPVLLWRCERPAVAVR
jgi:hypothetical protein